MKLEDAKLKEILLKGNYVTEEDIKTAEEATLGTQKGVLEYLLQESIVTKDLVGQAMAESFKVPYADLNSTPISKDQVQKIPEDLARKYRVVLFSEVGNKIVVTTDNPADSALQPEFSKKFFWQEDRLKLLSARGHRCRVCSLPKDA